MLKNLSSSIGCTFTNNSCWFTQTLTCLCMFKFLFVQHLYSFYFCVCVCVFGYMHPCSNVLACLPVCRFNLRPTKCDRGSMWKHYPQSLSLNPMVSLPSLPPSAPYPCHILVINKLFQPIIPSAVYSWVRADELWKLWLCVCVSHRPSVSSVSEFNTASTFVVFCETLLVSGITLIHCHLSNLLKWDVQVPCVV